MARFEKRRINETQAKELLGTAWTVSANFGRPQAKLCLDALRHSECVYRRYQGGICELPEMSARDATLGENSIVFEMLWPICTDCEIDLADFYWNKEAELQHPLKGFQITELVKATKYPFHNPERVRVIPAKFHGSTRTQLNVTRPEVVIFVEYWSHYDQYDTSEYDTPSEAFDIPNDMAVTYAEQFENEACHIGCNFIVMPVGYEYAKVECTKTAERIQSFKENREKWYEILQDFFNGEDEEAEVEVEAKQKGKAEMLPEWEKEAFGNWQQDLRKVWQPKFFSAENTALCKRVEVFICENKDRSAVLLYRAALADDTARSTSRLFKGMEHVNEVWYDVATFSYSQAHYTAFRALLNELVAEYSRTTVG